MKNTNSLKINHIEKILNTVKIKKEKILLKPSDIKPSSDKFEVLGVLNPATIRLKDGRILMYIRVIEKLKKIEDKKYYYVPRFVGRNKLKIKLDRFDKREAHLEGDLAILFKDHTKRLTFMSHLRRVYLDKSGMKINKIEQKPCFYGLVGDGELGVEDPRITKIDENYCMTYVGLSRREGISTYLASSKDGLNWERKGIIFGQQDKDVVLFSEKINDRYIAFDRPEGNFEFSTPHVWIAYSKDLLHWGELKAVRLAPKNKNFLRTGAGPPPIKTNKGWLQIYHAVRTVSIAENIKRTLRKLFGIDVEHGPTVYDVYADLLDLKNPSKIIAKSKSPILTPSRKYEISFEGKRVIFPTGFIQDLNKKDLILYCGAGDTSIIVKKIALRDIIRMVKK